MKDELEKNKKIQKYSARLTDKAINLQNCGIKDVSFVTKMA